MVEGLDVEGVKSIVLPVTWNEAPERALHAADEFGADVVLMNGVASPRQRLFIEAGATNRTAAFADAAGKFPIPESELVVRPMTIDLRAVARTARMGGVPLGEVLLGAQITAVRSTNAYVCNHLAFRVSARSSNRVTCGFLHWPSDLVGKHVDAARNVLESIVVRMLHRVATSV
jgi:pyrrolidone-carboxylate peptidase